MLIKGIYRSVNCLMMIFAFLNYDDVCEGGNGGGDNSNQWSNFVISKHILILPIVIPFEYYFISLTVAAWQIASRELNGSSFTAPMNHHELYQSSSSSIVIIFFSIFVSSFEFKCLSFLFHPVLMCRGVRNVFRLIHLPAWRPLAHSA